MQYYIITFGCQMNQSDSERIASVLKIMGYKAAKDLNSADLILVNMCSVRQSAVDRVFGLPRKFKDLKAKTILTGCVLKKDKPKMEKIFDYIVDIKDIGKLPKILGKKTKQKNNYLKINPEYKSTISAVIPIMTGCNNFCSYCVVPYTRGKEVSRPAKEIICEIKNLIQRNFKEIWLMGQNVNSYKDGSIYFPKLLEKINNIPGDFWIRFTSSHPKDFSEKLIEVMAKCKKITPYLNLPVQAGDDNVLKRMNRPYTIKQYKEAVRKVKSKIPNITISTDIIVGFPGETKKEFANSIKLFKEVEYDMAYISEYSKRHGTIAAKIKDNLSREEKTKRKITLNDILKKTALKKNKNYIGKTVRALMQEKCKDLWIGKTEEYKTIRIRSANNLFGKFIKAKIIKATPWGLEAEYEE